MAIQEDVSPLIRASLSSLNDFGMFLFGLFLGFFVFFLNLILVVMLTQTGIY